MNLFRKISLLTGLALSIVACKEEVMRPNSWPVWPTVSKPTISDLRIQAVETAGTLHGGDSALITVHISDAHNPLLEATLRLTLGDEEMAQQTFALSGQEKELQWHIRIPLLANRQSGQLGVRISATNAIKSTSEETLATDKQVALAAPSFGQALYLYFQDGSSQPLFKQAETDNYRTDATFQWKNLPFWICSALTSDEKMDVKGMVWSSNNNEIQANMPDGMPITLSLTSGSVLNGLQFNTSSFELGKLLSTAIKGIELGPSAYGSPYLFAQLDLTYGETVPFSGFSDITHLINPDFFTPTSSNSAVFTGPDGQYQLLYDVTTNFIYIENTATTYPAGMWICGTGLGFPQAPLQATTAWNWSKPTDYVYCKKVGDEQYEATVYATAGFMFKFFHQRNWGTEEDGRNYQLLPAGMLKDGTNEWGDKTGDVASGTDFTAGVYRIRIDRLAKTISLIK